MLLVLKWTYSLPVAPQKTAGYANVQGLVFLCHVTRRVSEQRVIDLAAAVGLVPMQCAAEEFESGPIRLLCFQRPALGN